MAEVLKAKDEAELETKQLRSLLATLQHKNTDLEAEAEAAKRRTNELKVEVEAAKQHASELEADLMAARTAAVSVSSTAEEVAQLKETIRLLELERSSTQNVCQKAIQVLDAKDSSLLQKELEKLKAREQHLREANEIFQQKLHMLTEENRRLRGIKQNY